MDDLLKLPERYEKKRNHIFWFSGLAVLLAIALIDDPQKEVIDVFKSGVNVGIGHLALLLFVVLIYQGISFYFEDRKVALLNSEITKRGDFGDAKDAFAVEASNLIEGARERIQGIKERAGRHDFDRLSESIRVAIDDLVMAESQLEMHQNEFARWETGDTEEQQRTGKLARELNVPNIRNTVASARTALENLEVSKISEANAAVADMKLANQRLEAAASAIESDLANLLDKLYTARSDLSRIDRIQLMYFERRVPYVALVAGLLASGFLAVRDLLRQFA